MKETADDREPANLDDDWCAEHELPEDTLCKVEAMKMMARWLLGLKTDNMSAQKTFRMLNAFIIHKGNFLIFIQFLLNLFST